MKHILGFTLLTLCMIGLISCTATGSPPASTAFPAEKSSSRHAKSRLRLLCGTGIQV